MGGALSSNKRRALSRRASYDDTPMRTTLGAAGAVGRGPVCLRTTPRPLLLRGGVLGLERGADGGVDDVLDGRAAREVVDGHAEPLHDGPDRARLGRLLHRLVAVVRRVEVGEDADGRAARDGAAAGRLDGRDVGVDRRVDLRGRRAGTLKESRRLGRARASAPRTWNGPSMSSSGARSCASAVALRTLSIIGPWFESPVA